MKKERVYDPKLIEFLKQVKEKKGSDLHMRVDDVPYVRIKGQLVSISESPLTSAEIFKMISSCISTKMLQIWKKKKTLDFSASIPGISRFRVNIFIQKGTPAAVFRQIPFEIPHIKDIDISDKVLDLLKNHSGLILVTGPTGSGKSTTIASLLNYINSKESKRIVTLEDPIEFLFKDQKCDIVQRELGEDMREFIRGLKSVLRQDPDIILVGEMRNLETIEMALTAAETGHLVLATLHTATSVETINRILSVFPYESRDYVREQLAGILRGAICQKLVPTEDKSKLVAVREILINTTGIANAIRGNNISQIQLALESGKREGMVSFDQSLEDLLKKKIISFDEAVTRAINPDRFFKKYR